MIPAIVSHIPALKLPRFKLPPFLAAFTGHLQRSSSTGHLLHNTAGHLIFDCCPEITCGVTGSSSNCPDTTSVPETIQVVLSNTARCSDACQRVGADGPSGHYSIDWTDLPADVDGTYTLTYGGSGSSTWQYIQASIITSVPLYAASDLWGECGDPYPVSYDADLYLTVTKTSGNTQLTVEVRFDFGPIVTYFDVTISDPCCFKEQTLTDSDNCVSSTSTGSVNGAALFTENASATGAITLCP